MKEIYKGKKAFYIHDSGAISIAYDDVWIAGRYADMEAAELGFKANPELLEALGSKLITVEDLK